MAAFYLIFISLISTNLRAADSASQASRILKQANAIKKVLRDSPPTKEDFPVEEAQKMRAHAFNLEELFRVYEEDHPKKLEGQFAAAKKLEDVLGQYVDGVEHFRMAEKMGVSKETLLFLKGQKQALFSQLVKTLTTGKYPWVVSKDDNAFSHIEEAVESVNWDGENKDRKLLIEHFMDLFQNLEDTDYDLSQTQGNNGLHELRRDLRKTIILMLTLNFDGKLILYDKSVPEFDHELKDKEFRKSKYGKLPVSKPKDLPILIPQPLYLAIAKKVQELGTAKDILEAQDEWLPKALVASGEVTKGKGETAAQFKKRLAKKVQDYIQAIPEWRGSDVAKLRKQAEKFINESGFLEDMKEVLEKQLDWSKDDCRSRLEKLGY